MTDPLVPLTCPHGDETCPCPDGDPCHYTTYADVAGVSEAMPCPRVETLRTAIRGVAQAIRDEGPAPRVHRSTLMRHREEWPTLWDALGELLRTFDASQTPNHETRWRHPRTLLGRYVRVERPRTLGEVEEYGKGTEGGEGIVADVIVTDGRVELVTDYGYAFPITDNTTVTFSNTTVTFNEEP